jgi:hypothetical protein
MSNTPRTRRPPAAKRPKTANPKTGTSGTAKKDIFLEVFGGKYKVAPSVGIWPLMQFARAAETGTSLTDHRGLAACHAFLEQVIAPAEWGRFQDDMISKRVNDLDALMAAARQAVEALTARQAAQNGNGRRAAANGHAVPADGEPAALTAVPDLRAGDTDRQAVMDQLDAALLDGRLDTDEHATRLAAARDAKTMTALAALTADLPAAVAETGAP